MGGFAPVLGQVLDPLNLTGVNDRPRAPNGPPPAHQPAAPLPEYSGDQKLSGFLAGMMPRQSAFLTTPSMGAAPPPPAHWAYDPKKGASWATPQRRGESDSFDMVNNAPGSEAFGSFQGNRI